MYTPQQVAQQIEILKPDLEEFNNQLHSKYSLEDFLYLKQPSNEDICLRLFKLELAAMYFTTHRQKGSWGYITDNVANFLAKHITYSNSSFIFKSHQKLRDFDFSYGSTKLSPDIHILANLNNLKQYLLPYLKSKIFPPVSNVTLKEPKDDEFSLSMFKSYIESLPKGVPSVELEGYLDKINRFKLKKKYLELLLDNCKAPSLKLQKKLIGYHLNNQRSLVKEKYMALGKWAMSHMASNAGLLVSYPIFDDSHSEYKPFITKLPRIATPDQHQLEYLVNSLMVFKFYHADEPNEVYAHFIESLTEHLNLPEYKEPLAKYMQTFNKQVAAMEDIQSTFKDN